jgi:hypothetical protein
VYLLIAGLIAVLVVSVKLGGLLGRTFASHEQPNEESEEGSGEEEESESGEEEEDNKDEKEQEENE